MPTRAHVSAVALAVGRAVSEIEDGGGEGQVMILIAALIVTGLELRKFATAANFLWKASFRAEVGGPAWDEPRGV